MRAHACPSPTHSCARRYVHFFAPLWLCLCSQDGFFGLLSQAFQRRVVETLQDLLKLRSKNNTMIDFSEGMRMWRDALDTVYVAPPMGFTKYQSFKVDAAHPGMIGMGGFGDIPDAQRTWVRLCPVGQEGAARALPAPGPKVPFVRTADRINAIAVLAKYVSVAAKWFFTTAAAAL